MNKEEILEEFQKKKWGACFECCDFEELLDDISKALDRYALELIGEDYSEDTYCEGCFNRLHNCVQGINKAKQEMRDKLTP